MDCPCCPHGKMTKNSNAPSEAGKLVYVCPLCGLQIHESYLNSSDDVRRICQEHQERLEQAARDGVEAAKRLEIITSRPMVCILCTPNIGKDQPALDDFPACPKNEEKVKS